MSFSPTIISDSKIKTQPEFRDVIHSDAPFKQIISILQRDNAPKLNGSTLRNFLFIFLLTIQLGIAALANLCRDASTHEKLSNFGLGGLLVQLVRAQLLLDKPDWQLVRQARKKTQSKKKKE